MDRDAGSPCDAACECDHTVGGGHNRRTGHSRQIHTPMASVRTQRTEGPDDGAGHRHGCGTWTAGRHGQRDEKNEEHRPSRYETNCPEAMGTPSTQAMPRASGALFSSDMATLRRSSGRKGLVRKESAPPRSARSLVSS